MEELLLLRMTNFCDKPVDILIHQIRKKIAIVKPRAMMKSEANLTRGKTQNVLMHNLLGLSDTMLA